MSPDAENPSPDVIARVLSSVATAHAPGNAAAEREHRRDEHVTMLGEEAKNASWIRRRATHKKYERAHEAALSVARSSTWNVMPRFFGSPPSADEEAVYEWLERRGEGSDLLPSDLVAQFRLRMWDYLYGPGGPPGGADRVLKALAADSSDSDNAERRRIASNDRYIRPNQETETVAIPAATRPSAAVGADGDPWAAATPPARAPLDAPSGSRTDLGFGP